MTMTTPQTSFCEGCGRPGGPASILERTNDRRLGWCPGCGALSCATCRVSPEHCVLCLPQPAPIPRRRPAVSRPALAVAGLAVAVLVVAVVAVTGLRAPRGAVLGDRATADAPAPAGSAFPGPSAADGGAPQVAEPGVEIAARLVPVWVDVLGGRHGEALFVVRNAGQDPLEIVPGESRYSVTAGGGTVATGVLDAAIPPVLGPGERGYVFAAFSLPARLPDDATAAVELHVRPPDPSLLTLGVRRVSLDTSGPTLAVTGVARNDGRLPASDGVVGAVVLTPGGQPLYAMVDAASAGLLQPGARRAFEAAHPAIPRAPGDRLGEVVAHAWAVAAEDRGSGRTPP